MPRECERNLNRKVRMEMNSTLREPQLSDQSDEKFSEKELKHLPSSEISKMAPVIRHFWLPLPFLFSTVPAMGAQKLQ